MEFSIDVQADTKKCDKESMLMLDFGLSAQDATLSRLRQIKIRSYRENDALLSKFMSLHEQWLGQEKPTAQEVPEDQQQNQQSPILGELVQEGNCFVM